jgi:hypothetical protein
MAKLTENVRQTALSAAAALEVAGSPIQSSSDLELSVPSANNSAVELLPNEQASAEDTNRRDPNLSIRRQQFGSFDFPEKRNMAKLKTGAEKLDLIKKTMNASKGVDPRQFSNPFRVFMSQTVEPALNCLHPFFK